MSKNKQNRVAAFFKARIHHNRRQRARLRIETLEARRLLTVAHADFNDDGYADLAVGVPFESVENIEDAGAVNVMYGSPSGISSSSDQIWSQDSPGVKFGAEEGDRFGEALATGDFNNDGYDDLAIGVPFEDLGSTRDAGVVNVIYGSPAGLVSTNDQVWHLNNSVSGYRAEAGDRFGQVLTTGDFNRDGIDDLAIGIPMRDVGQASDAGAIEVLYGTRSGLSVANNYLFHQDSYGIAGTAEAGDRFGWSLAAGDFDNDGDDDLVVGIPMEDVGSDKDAGAIHVINGSSSGLTYLGDKEWHQDSKTIKSPAEPGDHFGFSLASGDFNKDGRDDLAIGVPHENLNFVSDVGAVNIMYGTHAGLSDVGNQIFSQDTSGVNDRSEHRDQMGFSLISADFDNDGYADLAIGVPGEDIGAIDDAGAVNVLFGRSSGLSSAGDEFWHQNRSGIQGTAEPRDRFGMGLATGDLNGDGKADLIVGIPFEDIGSIPDAGAIHAIMGSSSGLTSSGDVHWGQNSSGIKGYAETNDQMGHFGGATSLSEFHIDLNFADFGLTESQQHVFVEAARRWSEIILGDLPDTNVFSIGAVDDLWIDIYTPALDGPGGNLGNGNAVTLRPGSNLPSYGVMRFDSADVDAWEASGGLYNLILHEMGHVLGIGTLWGVFSLLDGAGTTNPTYKGSTAVEEYNDIFGNTATSIPVENSGGSGTADVHWRESVFTNELMTGWLTSGQSPLSRITVGSLQDMGYEVALDAADVYPSVVTVVATPAFGSSSSFASAKSFEPQSSKPSVAKQAAARVDAGNMRVNSQQVKRRAARTDEVAARAELSRRASFDAFFNDLGSEDQSIPRFPLGLLLL